MIKMKRDMLIVVFLLILFGGALFYQSSLPDDRCSSADRQNNNCVPAGKCGPTSALDAVMDCEPKNYDRKFDISVKSFEQ